VLRSPFTEFAAAAQAVIDLPLPVMRTLFNRTELPVESLIAAGGVPVTVVWGDSDTIVPPELSSRVADAARSAGTLVEAIAVRGAGHNDGLWQGQSISDVVVRLADATIGD
jgi:pimeloyl-ACP methyl ester carboxylesterase